MKEAQVGVDCEHTPVSSCPSPGGVHEAISPIQITFTASASWIQAANRVE